MPPFTHTSYSLCSIFILRLLILSSVARLDLSVNARALKAMCLEWTLREHLPQSLYFTDNNISIIILYVSGESTHCEDRDGIVMSSSSLEVFKHSLEAACQAYFRDKYSIRTKRF